MASTLNRPIVCPRLIGRARYLDAVASALSETQRHTGHTMLISGEAGIGKTRLVGEMVAMAERNGMRVLLGNCYEAERSIPLAPLTDVLHEYLATAAEQEAQRVAHDFGPYLLTLIPDLATRFPGLLPPPALEPEHNKRRLFAAITDLLLSLAHTGPVLLCLEDAHWADDTSLDLLLHLARQSANRAFLLAITYRSDEILPALRHLLAELDRGRLASDMVLAPLSQVEIGSMLQAIFDLPYTPRGELPEVLHALTEGNPFFIEEVLHVLVADGDIYVANGKWERKPLEELRIPRSVHDTVQRRRERISPAADGVLRLAAVAGRRFEFTVLQQVGAYDEAELLVSLKELVGAQLLIEESADHYAFRHALTRRAVYSELLARERRALHRAVAETIERTSAGAPDPPLSDLAYHYFEAGAWEQALRYAWRVGEQALAVLALPAAIEHFTHALQAAERLGLPPPVEVLRARGQAHGLLGEFERAQADYDAARVRAHAAGELAQEWQTLRDLGLLWSGREYERAGRYYQQAFELARAADDPPMLARSVNSLGNWLLNTDQPLDARRYHEQALAIFETIGDRVGTAETLDLLGMTLYLSGDSVGGTAAYQRAVPLLRDLDDRVLLCSTLATLGMRAPSWHTDTLVPVSSLPDSLAPVREALTHARDIQLAAGEAYAQLILAYNLGSMGDYAAALEALRLGQAVAREIEHHQWLCALEYVEGEIYRQLGAVEQAQRLLTEAYQRARELGSQHWQRSIASYLALTSLQQGRIDDAAALLDEIAPRATPIHTLGQRLARCARVELAFAQQAPAQALAWADSLAAATPNARTPEQIPRVTWLRGRALRDLQRFDEAEAALLAAEHLAMTYHITSILWMVRADLAAMERTRGRHEAAERYTSAGRRTVDAVASTVPATLREEFVRMATGRFQHAQRAEVAAPHQTRILPRVLAPGGLTPREVEVASLVARGLSNRAIAAELIVGERTVETHVTNILGKLTFTSRAQIAVWAAEHRLLADHSTP